MQDPTTGNPQDTGNVQNQTEKRAEPSSAGSPQATNQVSGKPANKANEQPPTGKNCLESVVPEYALVFFDHLYSEYLAFKNSITDQQVILLLDGIHGKRAQCKLTWSDIYTFDLKLVQARPTASLIRKAYDTRQRYRSIAGQKEYDEYLASNPPNLIEIKVAPNAQPPEPDAVVEIAVRADLEYLLSKIFLYYATLPERERLRDQLTKRAVNRTLVFVGILLALILLNLGMVRVFELGSTVGLTVLTVALAGIMGGCVSMLQRIQSSPSEGDALFNLASLNNGWTGLSLSPLYGGIFASLLFILFAAGILEGSVFPKIHTPGKFASSAAPSAPSSTPTASPKASPSASAKPTPSTSPTASPAASSASPTAQASLSNASSPVASATTSSPDKGGPVSEPVKSPTASPSVSPRPEPTPQVIRIKTFLVETGPVDGVSYALLIIWSFLAGFAERLVPDTLNRLVAKNEAIQGRS